MGGSEEQEKSREPRAITQENHQWYNLRGPEKSLNVLNLLRILRWFEAKHQTKPGGHPSCSPCAAAHVTYLWSRPCRGARSQVPIQGSSGKNIYLSSGTGQMSSSLASASLNSSLTADCTTQALRMEESVTSKPAKSVTIYWISPVLSMANTKIREKVEGKLRGHNLLSSASIQSGPLSLIVCWRKKEFVALSL